MQKINLQPIKWALLIKYFVLNLIIFYFLFSPVKIYAQQSFPYTQYMINPVPLNTSFSLVDKDIKADIMLRQQWAGIHGAPATQFVDGFMPFEKVNGAGGLIFQNDKIGAQSLTKAIGFYSQQVRVDTQKFLALSLNMGFINYAENYSTTQETDPLLRQNINETKPSLGFSMLYFSQNYYVGISVPQFTINGSGNSLTSLNNNFRNNYFLSGGLTHNMLNGLKLQYATLLSYTRGFGTTADISGMFFYKEKLGFGLNYCTTNNAALILATRFKLFNFGYSYQFALNSENNIGGLINATQELTISYSLGHKRFYVKKGSRVF